MKRLKIAYNQGDELNEVVPIMDNSFNLSSPTAGGHKSAPAYMETPELHKQALEALKNSDVKSFVRGAYSNRALSDVVKDIQYLLGSSIYSEYVMGGGTLSDDAYDAFKGVLRKHHIYSTRRGGLDKPFGDEVNDTVVCASDIDNPVTSPSFQDIPTPVPTGVTGPSVLSPSYQAGKRLASGDVAKTILQQLGGNKFLVMTGAKNLGYSANSLQFKIGKNSKGVTHVIIKLNSKDLYDMTFSRYWGNKENHTDVKDVYNDQLQDVFTKYTGLYTHL